MSGPFYDDLESRDPEIRERDLMAALPEQIRHAKSKAEGWSKRLSGVDADAVASRDALADIPVLRKPKLMSLQQDQPPFGNLTATPASSMTRVYMSPGPVYEPEGAGPDWWRVGRALFAAGVRPGDRVQNCFAFNFTPGGWIMDSGIRAIGCPSIAAGVGNTEMQLATLRDFKPTCFAGTPDFLKIILDKADEMSVDASSITKGLVSGGALFPSLRQEYRDRGVSVLQCYVTADLGLISYESSAMEGMIVDEGVILEIVRPGSNTPVPAGEVGEIVVTTFNRDYPMIRFGTGDLSAVMEGASPCGRTNMRIKGWMGRADQRTKIKGMFVDPEQVNAIAERHPELGRVRMVVARVGEQDGLTLMAECEQTAEGLADRVGESLQAIAKLKGAVEFVAPGSLPNDGKVISDERSYD